MERSRTLPKKLACRDRATEWVLPPCSAGTLINIATLYRTMKRLREANDASTEALQTYRDLAKANPQAYLPGMAMALMGFGNICYETQRLKKATDAYYEALQTYSYPEKCSGCDLCGMYCPDFAICASKVASGKNSGKYSTTKTPAIRRRKVTNEG